MKKTMINNFRFCMHKQGLMILLLVFSINTSKAQQIDSLKVDSLEQYSRTRVMENEEKNVAYKQNIIHPSPQTYLFKKYIDHEISEYTGVPNIEIPLYEIKLKNTTIPISLSYHASGIKYRQSDGDVGVGWSINAGGYRISREVRGRDDLKGFKGFNEEEYKNTLKIESLPERYYTLNSYEASFAISHRSDEIGFQNIFKQGEIARDGERDIYTYMLPTTGSKFIIPEADMLSATSMFIEEKQDLVKFKTTPSWEITDNKGNEYLFGTDDYKADDKPHTFVEVYKDKTILYDGPLTGDHTSTRNIQAWLLKTMKTPFGENIEFKYQRHSNKLYASTVGTGYTDAAIVRNMGESSSVTEMDSHSLSERDDKDARMHSGYIESIKTDNELVEFHRGVKINGHTISHLLNSVKIKDLDGNVIKVIRFSYHYTSPNKSRHPYDKTQSWRIPHHVLLQSVSIGNEDEALETFELAYYLPNPAYSPYPDQWGYYRVNGDWINGYSATDIEPSRSRLLNGAVHKDFIAETNILSKQYTEWQFGEGAGGWVHGELNKLEYSFGKISNTTGLWVDRTPSESDVKAFSLKKIRNPLGGYTEYEYEPNKYLKGNNEILGAGIRVHKITSIPNSDTPPVVTTFAYKKGRTKGKLENHNLLRFFSGFHFNLGYRGEDKSTSPSDLYGCRNLPEADFLDCQYNIRSRYENMRIARSFMENSDVSMFNDAAQVYYDTITTTKTDIRGNILGKTKSVYEGLDGIAMSKFEYVPGYEGLVENDDRSLKYYLTKATSSCSTTEAPNKTPVCLNTLVRDWGHYYPSANLSAKPHLKIREIFSENNKTPIRVEEYFHGKTTSKISSTGYLTKQIASVHHYDDAYKKLQALPLFSTGKNSTDMVSALLTKKKIKDYTAGGIVEQTEEFDYDTKSRLKSHKVTNSANKILTTSYTYPSSNTELEKRNMLSTIIEESTLKNGIATGLKKTFYPLTKILPDSILSGKDKASLIKDLTFDKYDITTGNILQYREKDGSPISILWSYNNKYPIAVCENMTYAQAENVIKDHFGVSSNALALQHAPSEDKIISLSTNKNIPTTAAVTTYSYKPLIGILSETNSHGITRYYKYDKFNKLNQILGSDNNIIEECNYNFSPKLSYSNVSLTFSNITYDSKTRKYSAETNTSGGSGYLGYNFSLFLDGKTADGINYVTFDNLDKSNKIHIILSKPGSGLYKFEATVYDYITGMTKIVYSPEQKIEVTYPVLSVTTSNSSYDEKTRKYSSETIASGGSGNFKYTYTLFKDGKEIDKSIVDNPKYETFISASGLYKLHVKVEDTVTGLSKNAYSNELKIIPVPYNALSVILPNPLYDKESKIYSAELTVTGGSGYFSYIHTLIYNGEVLEERKTGSNKFRTNILKSGLYKLQVDVIDMVTGTVKTVYSNEQKIEMDFNVVWLHSIEESQYKISGKIKTNKPANVKLRFSFYKNSTEQANAGLSLDGDIPSYLHETGSADYTVYVGTEKEFSIVMTPKPETKNSVRLEIIGIDGGSILEPSTAVLISPSRLASETTDSIEVMNEEI